MKNIFFYDITIDTSFFDSYIPEFKDEYGDREMRIVLESIEENIGFGR